ncbi:hypothetical protein RFI_29611 [Reticulomyxa filosa]|uniref:RRM domain-containing protein n=1 Tax=Reticulomyxa filosa TaxID=46433 RepID=X6M1L4_RETFI|nr:hypothetical protein RFI_29611 [Reticulomyxa filosa]|eukprot:ETO07779.1 hypothetical protein RFI_29611 [Reticulomyxa filosa]
MSGSPKRKMASNVVRLTGIPFTCTETEIRAFFNAQRILKIKILTDKYGKNSGHALVEFASEGDMNQALLKDKHYIGRRYIDVNRASKRDMNTYFRTKLEPPGSADSPKESHDNSNGNNISNNSMNHSNNSLFTGHRPQRCVLKVKGLPFNVTAAEIIHFFKQKDPQLQPSQIYLTLDEANRLNGNAFVVFKKQEHRKLHKKKKRLHFFLLMDKKEIIFGRILFFKTYHKKIKNSKALSLDRQHIRQRYVELFKSNDYEMSLCSNILVYPSLQSEPHFPNRQLQSPALKFHALSRSDTDLVSIDQSCVLPDAVPLFVANAESNQYHAVKNSQQKFSVLLRGLPDVTADDVMHFFQKGKFSYFVPVLCACTDRKIYPVCVHKKRGVNQALVEFDNPAAVRAAMSPNPMFMNDKWVTLQLVDCKDIKGEENSESPEHSPNASPSKAPEMQFPSFEYSPVYLKLSQKIKKTKAVIKEYCMQNGMFLDSFVLKLLCEFVFLKTSRVHCQLEMRGPLTVHLNESNDHQAVSTTPQEYVAVKYYSPITRQLIGMTKVPLPEDKIRHMVRCHYEKRKALSSVQQHEFFGMQNPPSLDSLLLNKDTSCTSTDIRELMTLSDVSEGATMFVSVTLVSHLSSQGVMTVLVIDKQRKCQGYTPWQLIAVCDDVAQRSELKMDMDWFGGYVHKSSAFVVGDTCKGFYYINESRQCLQWLPFNVRNIEKLVSSANGTMKGYVQQHLEWFQWTDIQGAIMALDGLSGEEQQVPLVLLSYSGSNLAAPFYFHTSQNKYPFVLRSTDPTLLRLLSQCKLGGVYIDTTMGRVLVIGYSFTIVGTKKKAGRV